MKFMVRNFVPNDKIRVQNFHVLITEGFGSDQYTFEALLKVNLNDTDMFILMPNLCRREINTEC